jgi:hypothetical protein
MTLIAIDPGFNGTGIAAFTDEGRLVDVALVVPPSAGQVDFAERLRQAIDALPDSRGADLIIEFPDRDDRKGDITDLFKLAAITGAISVAPQWRGSRISYVFPSEWKGNVPKDIHGRRIVASLTPKERAILEKRGADHNVIDAVGLGKWRFVNRIYQSRFSNLSRSALRKKIRTRVRK